AKAGASVVAIDVFPKGSSPGDASLAESIKRAEQLGTHVILGTEGVTDSGEPQTEIPQVLLDALQDKIGNIQNGFIAAGFRPALKGVVLGNEITAGPRAQPSGHDASIAPSFVLQTIRHFNLPANARAAELVFDRENRIIKSLSNGEPIRPIPVNDDD